MSCPFRCKSCGRRSFVCKATNPRKKIIDKSLCEDYENCTLYRLRMRLDE